MIKERKIWITHDHTGYSLWNNKPTFKDYWSAGEFNKAGETSDYKQAKQRWGLKKNLPVGKEGIVEGYLTVEFEEVIE